MRKRLVFVFCTLSAISLVAISAVAGSNPGSMRGKTNKVSVAGTGAGPLGTRGYLPAAFHRPAPDIDTGRSHLPTTLVSLWHDVAPHGAPPALRYDIGLRSFHFYDLLPHPPAGGQHGAGTPDADDNGAGSPPPSHFNALMASLQGLRPIYVGYSGGNFGTGGASGGGSNPTAGGSNPTAGGPVIFSSFTTQQPTGQPGSQGDGSAGGPRPPGIQPPGGQPPGDDQGPGDQGTVAPVPVGPTLPLIASAFALLAMVSGRRRRAAAATLLR